MALELPEEYLEYLKQNVGFLERLGDALSGADERLDYAIKKQGEILERLKSLMENAGIEVKGMPENIREFRIQQTVPAATGVILNQMPPFDGYIREVKIHWPPGCNAFVDVRVGHGTKQFCPFEGFLSLDAVTPTYPFNEYVEHTENIWVEIQNTDGGNPHTISVMINMVEAVHG
jgi:hypothetical protein